jgi:ribosomal protein S18 acetylase RimI-like enzyme
VALGDPGLSRPSAPTDDKEDISYPFMNSVAIRHARNTEPQTILALLEELGRPCAGPGSALRRRVREVLEREDVDVLIAESDGEVAGLACLLVLPRLGHPTPEARLLDLIVVRDRRGDGVGRALVAAVSRLAAAADAHVLRLECGHHRAGANHFYERLGFENRGIDWQLPLPSRLAAEAG